MNTEVKKGRWGTPRMWGFLVIWLVYCAIYGSIVFSADSEAKALSAMRWIMALSTIVFVSSAVYAWMVAKNFGRFVVLPMFLLGSTGLVLAVVGLNMTSSESVKPLVRTLGAFLCGTSSLFMGSLSIYLAYEATTKGEEEK